MGDESTGEQHTGNTVIIAPEDTLIAKPRHPGREPRRRSDLRIGKISKLYPLKGQSPQR